MFCKNCGNKLNDNDNFCSVCGTKVENGNNIVGENSFNQNIQNSTISNIKSNNFLLSNKAVLWLFSVNTLLLFFGIINGWYNLLMDSDVASGFFIFVSFIIAFIFIIPHSIGYILSTINLKIKNYVMLIFIFIVSVLSLFTTIASYSPSMANNNGILFWICLILSVALCIIVLFKLILKIKE